MISSETTEIGKLLNTGDRRFAVPMYQRAFVWGKDQTLEMLEDLRNSQNNAFLGTIVLHEASKGNLQIVDGQQRITTIFVLLACIRQRALNLKKHDLASTIQSKITFINESTGETLGSRLIPTDYIREVFNETIGNNQWKGTFDIPELKNKKLQVRRLKPVYDTFNTVISKLSLTELSEILANLYRSEFVVIKIHDEAEAFEIFERSNARGLDLNVSDLLKNYLFANVSELGKENIESSWDTISDYSGSSITQMLRYYYVIKEGHVQKKDLYRNLRKYGDQINANKLLEELEEFSYIYSSFSDPTKDALLELVSEKFEVEGLRDEYRLDDLRESLEAFRLLRVTQAYPVILSLFYSLIERTDKSKNVAKKFVTAINNLEKYHFINIISGHAGNEVEKDYAKIAHTISETVDFEDSLKMLNKFLQENLEKREIFVSKFSEISYSQSDLGLIYYIFDRLNNYELSGGQKKTIYDSDSKLRKTNHNIEHLMPQSKISDEESEYFTHLIGNLLLIPLHTNSDMQDYSFDRKIEFIKKDIHLPNVKQFVGKYGNKKDWTTEDIQERCRELGEFAYDEVWKLK